MNTQAANFTEAPQVRGARRWLVAYPRAIPLAIFLAIATITAIGVFAIESNARASEKARLSRSAQNIAAELERRGTSFSSYLRAGAALFSSLDEVSSRGLQEFVDEFEIEAHYRGAEGFGFAEVSDADAPGQRSVVVSFIYPDTERNQLALGYDMSTDPVRVAAMEQAVREQSPTASGKVVLQQEGFSDGAGFVIFMPVYTGDGAERRLTGFVYSPFQTGEFLASAIDQTDTQGLGVSLYDRSADPENLLVATGVDSARSDMIEQPVTIAHHDMMMVVKSPAAPVLAPLSMLTLLFGIATASLLMMLVRLLTRQAFEDRERLDFYEEQLSIRNLLTRELNHRVKNTLANVLSILSLTRRRTDNLDDFADSLEGRIRSLSATHDLLTHSDWGTIPIEAVIEAELQHFRASKDQSVTIEGPHVELAPNDALSFGLALHELATNAAKYGSLSVTGGAVTVRWDSVDEDVAEVEWCERAGPPVAEMRKRGFGTDLIEKIVAHELKHPVQLDFEREGVRCVIRIPIRRSGEFSIREG
ncbi:MAG: CHASE domain-containing protein [Pseudomonadota bacterium]